MGIGTPKCEIIANPRVCIWRQNIDFGAINNESACCASFYHPKSGIRG